MEMTFPSCATKSSSCSLREGVMCALTWAVRFSRFMALGIKKPRRATSGANQQSGQGGGGESRNYCWIGVIVLLAGCASNSITPTSKHFTIEHGTMRFGSALSQAKRHCESLGMETKHTRTDSTGFYMVSSFECVPK